MGKYEFDVKMSCGGCSGAVKKALSKMEGITYSVSLEEQKVVVEGNVPYETVLERIKKTGKEVTSGRTIDSRDVDVSLLDSIYNKVVGQKGREVTPEPVIRF